MDYLNGWAVADPLYCAGCGLFLHITKPTNQYDTCPGGLGGGGCPLAPCFLSTLLTLTEHYALLIAKEIILELLSGGGIITEDHERCKYLFWNELIPSGRLLTFLLLLKVLETYRLDKMQFRLEKKKTFLEVLSKVS